ncbi:MAG: hypothetical protein Q4E62_10000, partial [Sutterellaceae bacterium]|nr:hypothetical protein [Sutterellaceae bacterium]
PSNIYDNPQTEFVATFVGGMNIVHLPEINEGAATGIRYGDVLVSEANEAALSRPYTYVGQLQSLEFMGDNVRGFFLLNDFKTQIIADISRARPVASSLQEKGLYALHLEPSVWRRWSR